MRRQLRPMRVLQLVFVVGAIVRLVIWLTLGARLRRVGDAKDYNLLAINLVQYGEFAFTPGDSELAPSAAVSGDCRGNLSIVRCRKLAGRGAHFKRCSAWVRFGSSTDWPRRPIPTGLACGRRMGVFLSIVVGIQSTDSYRGSFYVSVVRFADEFDSRPQTRLVGNDRRLGRPLRLGRTDAKRCLAVSLAAGGISVLRDFRRRRPPPDGCVAVNRRLCIHDRSLEHSQFAAAKNICGRRRDGRAEFNDGQL